MNKSGRCLLTLASVKCIAARIVVGRGVVGISAQALFPLPSLCNSETTNTHFL